MDAPELGSEPPTRSPLPDPTEHSLPCEVCSTDIFYWRITTPEGMPEFIRPLDDTAWIGWSYSEPDKALSLVATCSRECLGEWWLNQTEPGA